MKEFKKWFENIEENYPKYQDKDGYNIGNVPALKVSWKAALEWVLFYCCPKTADTMIEIDIKEELKEE